MNRPLGFFTSIMVVAFAALGLSVPSVFADARPNRPQITEANGAPLQSPEGLSVDGSGNLWVSDTASSLVSEFSSSGGYLNQSEGAGAWEGSSYIESLAFSEAAAEVFVSDSNLDDIWGLKSSAANGADFFGPPWDSGEHEGCCFLRVAADNSAGEGGGDLYVSNGSTVSRIAAQTGAAADFSSSEPYVSGDELTGPFSSASALALDGAGHLYVAAGSTVYEFEPSGALLI